VAGVRITFTWTPDRPTDQTPDQPDRVYLHVTGVHDHHAAELHHMRRTGDRWVSTVEIPDGLTASYRIMPVSAADVARLDPPGPVDTRARWVGLCAYSVPHVLDHPAWRPATDGASGVLVMPDAPEASGWDAADIPGWRTGTVGERRVWTSVPDGATYLLVLSDGENWARTALPAALDRLRAAGRLPATAVVAVDTAADRLALLSRSQRYRDLIADEVVPLGWRLLGRPHDRTRTVVSGESLGGLSALDLVLRRPDAAALVVATSGSFWFPDWREDRPGGEVAEEIRAGGVPTGVRVHLSVGTGEGHGMPEHARAVHAALRQAGVPATLEVADHGHEMAAWTGALTRGLVELLGG
jgi:enterochelin esterase-like enzyme